MPELKLFTQTSARCYDKSGRIIEASLKELWFAMSDAIKYFDQKDEQYFINKKVQEHLQELRHDDEMRFERKANTYFAVTGSSSFVQDARKRSQKQRSSDTGQAQCHDTNQYDRHHDHPRSRSKSRSRRSRRDKSRSRSCQRRRHHHSK